MILAGIRVVDTQLVRDSMDLARSLSEPYIFNHVMRSWIFGVLIAADAQPAPDPELLAVSAILHDLGLTDRYTAQERFEVDGANAARSFLRKNVAFHFLDCLCGVVRRKPATSYDNSLRDLGTRYVEGYAAPSVADLLENAPFNE
jgi:HD superfamily phosphodiesterase